MFQKFLQYYRPIFLHRNYFILYSLLLWLILDTGYRYFVYEFYEYLGFNLFPTIKYLEALIIYLILIFYSPKNIKKPSDFYINILLFVFIAPLLVFYGLADKIRLHLYIILLGFFIIDLIRRGKYFRIPYIIHGFNLVILLSVLGLVAGTIDIISKNLILNFDFSKVYETRSQQTISDNTIFRYLNFWVYKVFGPTLLVITLWKKKYFLSIFIIFLFMFWFGVSNIRSVLFYPLIIFFSWIFFSNNKNLSLIPFFLSICLALSLLMWIILDEPLLSSLIIRRALFAPSMLSFGYYDFFSTREFIFWSNSIFSLYLQYPYDLHPSKLIGEYLGIGGNPNNSFLSTGFMHAGILGVVFYSLICGLIFRIIDSISNKGVPIIISILITIVPLYSIFTSVDLFTGFLTHGLGLSLIFLFLLRKYGFK